MKNIKKARNYLVEEINQNEFKSKKHKNVCTTLNHIEHLASVVTGCVSISAFASLVGISIDITSSTVGLKIYSISAEIKKV